MSFLSFSEANMSSVSCSCEIDCSSTIIIKMELGN